MLLLSDTGQMKTALYPANVLPILPCIRQMSYHSLLKDFFLSGHSDTTRQPITYEINKNIVFIRS